MKYLLTAAVFCFCLAGMANVDMTSNTEMTQIETTVFDGGKKKARRTKRVKKKRKRRCRNAARRNFAG